MHQAPSNAKNKDPARPNGVPPGFSRERLRRVSDRDPLQAVIALERGHTFAGFSAWLAAATFLQGSFALWLGVAALGSMLGWAEHVRAAVRDRLTQEYEIVVEKPEEPPPPPPPEPEKEPEPPPPPTAAPPAQAPKETPPPAPAAAQAAAALTANPDPNEPTDLTNTIITGNANTYAGGSTMANGTSTKAVGGPVRADGAPGGTGTAPAPTAPKVNRSRVAGTSNTDWRCPFPAEADVAQVDDARVTIEVNVRADGTAAGVRAVSNPGYGFARQAVQCGQRQQYIPALDVDGNPIPSTRSFIVKFER